MVPSVYRLNPGYFKACFLPTATDHRLTQSSTYGASCIAPGLPGIVREFGVSREVATVSITLYVLGLGVGPIVYSGLSETYGRRAINLISMPLCMLFIMGAGLARNITTLLVCRFLAGAASSGPLTNGAGQVADISPLHLRGFATGIWLIGPFLGPALGPTTTSYAAHLQTWRWTQWEHLILCGVFWLISLGQKETYKKAILKRRAKRLNLEPPHDPIPSGFAKVRFLINVTIIRAMRMLFTEPIVGLFSVYIAFNFAVLFGFFNGVLYVFEHTYGWSIAAASLPFLSVGCGVTVGTGIFLLIDRQIWQRKRRRASTLNAGPLPPEERLYGAMVGSCLLPIGLFWFAWTARPSVHFMVPIVALAFFGAGNLLVFDAAVLYLIDCYGAGGSASAMSANNLLRYLLASVFPLFTVQMFERLGNGWAGSLLGFIALGLMPVPWVFYRYGKQLRGRSSFETSKA
jgi:MFS family permease